MALWNRCSICGRDIPVGERCYGVKKSGESICFDCIELENAPAEVVSKTAFEQVVWERDTALRQLREDYGVGLGEKKRDVAGVRHGKWKYDPNGMDWGLGAWVCSVCGCKNNNLGTSERINPYLFSGSKFCPNCGARMTGGNEK